MRRGSAAPSESPSAHGSGDGATGQASRALGSSQNGVSRVKSGNTGVALLRRMERAEWYHSRGSMATLRAAPLGEEKVTPVLPRLQAARRHQRLSQEGAASEGASQSERFQPSPLDFLALPAALGAALLLHTRPRPGMAAPPPACVGHEGGSPGQGQEVEEGRGGRESPPTPRWGHGGAAPRARPWRSRRGEGGRQSPLRRHADFLQR